MALIQKLQRGKTIQGGANTGFKVTDFDSFVSTVLHGGEDVSLAPYAFTRKSTEAIQRDWDVFKNLRNELTKHNLKIEDVFTYDKVNKKHNVNQDTVGKLMENENFDKTALENIINYTPQEGVKTGSFSGLRRTDDGIAAILDLYAYYKEGFQNKPTTSTATSTANKYRPKDPYTFLQQNPQNYSAMDENAKKLGVFNRGRTMLNDGVLKDSTDPDVVAMRDFYTNNPEFSNDIWDSYKNLATNLGWTVNFSVPTSEDDTPTYEIDHDLYTFLRQSGGDNIERIGENEFKITGLSGPLMYNGQVLYENPNKNWSLVDKNSVPSTVREIIRKAKIDEGDLFANQPDKVIQNTKGHKPITINGVDYNKFINLTPNTTLKNGYEFLLTKINFDDFGETTNLIGSLNIGNKRWNVQYNLGEDGTYVLNTTKVPGNTIQSEGLKFVNIPEDAKSFRINKDEDGRNVKRKDFSFTGQNQDIAFDLEGIDLKNIKATKVTYRGYEALKKVSSSIPDNLLLEYLKWLHTTTNQEELAKMGWTYERKLEVMDEIMKSLKGRKESIAKHNLGGVVLADINKKIKEEKENLIVAEPTKNPNERALVSMSGMDKGLLIVDGVATGLSMVGGVGGVAGVVGGLALLVSGIGQDIRNDSSAGEIAKNAAVNLGFAALAFVPGMSAFRAAKGAKSLLSATKTAKAVGKVAETANVVKKAEVAGEIANLTKKVADAKKAVSTAKAAGKTTKTITNLTKEVKEAKEALKIAKTAGNNLDEVIKLGQNNIDDAIKLLSTSKNKTAQVEKAISNLEKAKEAVTPNFVNQIISGGPVLKTISLATRGSLVVDGLVNGIPSALKIADVTFDKMRGEDVNFSHAITEGDLRNTLRLAGASKALKQFANQGLVRLGTTSTAKSTDMVKTDKVVPVKGKISKTGAFSKNAANKISDASKNTVSWGKDNYNKVFGNIDRTLKPSSINDGWFKTLARSRAAKFGYTSEGFNPNLNKNLIKSGMFEKGKLTDDIVETINSLLNQ